MGRSKVVWLRRAALACMAVAALGMLLSRWLLVRDIELVGAEKGDEQAILSACGMEAGDSLLRLDWQAAEQGISALGSYALEEGRATLTGRLRLCVRRRESAAMLPIAGSMAVVDEDMRVIELRQDAPDRDVLLINGMDASFASLGEVIGGDQAQVEACRAVLAAAQACGAAGFISEVNVADTGNIQMIAGSGMRILLGDAGKLADKLSLAHAAMQDIHRRGEGGGVLDVAGVSHADYQPANPAMQAEPVSAEL